MPGGICIFSFYYLALINIQTMKICTTALIMWINTYTLLVFSGRGSWDILNRLDWDSDSRI